MFAGSDQVKIGPRNARSDTSGGAMRAMELLTAPARRWAQGKRRGEQLTLVADAVDPAQDSATIATNAATMQDAQSTQPGEWTLAQRIAFRFAFVYFVVYSFPYP